MKKCIPIIILTLLMCNIIHAEIVRLIGPPNARSYACMIADTAHARAILFGGWGVGQYLNDVWSFDFSSEVWSLINPSGQAPPVRREATALYHGAQNAMIVFGGTDGNTYYNDVWALTLTPGSEAWVQVQTVGTPPSPRTSSKSVYDPINNRMIIFGGTSPSVGFNETWSLDFETLQWELLAPSGTLPHTRFAHCAEYDPNGHRMIVFAGVAWGYSMMDDVWALDLTSGAESWQRLYPSGPQPSARCQHTSVYDHTNHEMLLGFGYAYPPFVFFNDIWALDFGSLVWRQLNLVGPTISPRRAVSMACDPVDYEVVIFGGNLGNDNPYNDTYILELEETGTAVEEHNRIDIAGHEYIEIQSNPSRLPCRMDLNITYPSMVRLDVFDVSGRVIHTLLNRRCNSGNIPVQWDGKDNKGKKVAAGTYFINLEIDGISQVEKVVLIE